MCVYRLRIYMLICNRVSLKFQTENPIWCTCLTNRNNLSRSGCSLSRRSRRRIRYEGRTQKYTQTTHAIHRFRPGGGHTNGLKMTKKNRVICKYTCRLVYIYIFAVVFVAKVAARLIMWMNTWTHSSEHGRVI